MTTLMRRPSWSMFDFEWPHSLFGEWPAMPAMPAEVEMKIEEYRDGDTLVVKAELPGIDPEKDVEITVRDNVLSIHAERRSQTEEKTDAGFRSEFQYGSFVRRLRLPAGATEDDVKATYTDGILEVRIPLDRKQAEARTISVTRT